MQEGNYPLNVITMDKFKVRKSGWAAAPPGAGRAWLVAVRALVIIRRDGPVLETGQQKGFFTGNICSL